MVSNAFPLTRKSTILSKETIRTVWHNLFWQTGDRWLESYGKERKGTRTEHCSAWQHWLCHTGTVDTVFSLPVAKQQRGLRKGGFEGEEFNRFVGNSSQMRELEEGKAMNLMITFTSVAVDTLNDDEWQRWTGNTNSVRFLTVGQLRNQMKTKKPVFFSHNM